MSWLYVPQCSHCVPDTEDLNWGSEMLASALASSVTWRGKPSPPRTWLRRFKQRPWIRLLSGLTCEHSTHGPLQGSICSWRASLVSPGAPQVSEKVSMTSGGFGQMSLALSTSADPVPSSSSAPPASKSEGSLSCSGPLPARGMMQRGHVTSLPPRPGRPIVGRGSSWSRGMYPTPTASRYGSSQNGINGKGGEKERPSAGTPSLATWAQRWPTPAVSDSRSSGRHTTTTGVMHPGTSLTDAMRSHLDQTTPQDGDDGSPRAVLNPAFLEALLGIPTGWTGFASQATESSPPKPA